MPFETTHPGSPLSLSPGAVRVQPGSSPTVASLPYVALSLPARLGRDQPLCRHDSGLAGHFTKTL